MVSMVDDGEVFKICLEYWLSLSSDLFHHEHSSVNSMCGNTSVLMVSPDKLSARLTTYAPVLKQVRIAVVSRMAKPEEILIVQDENGELIQEEVPDTDEIIMYNSMRDTLIYLTHLNPSE